jgi:hypothetical protein
VLAGRPVRVVLQSGHDLNEIAARNVDHDWQRGLFDACTRNECLKSHAACRQPVDRAACMARRRRRLARWCRCAIYAVAADLGDSSGLSGINAGIFLHHTRRGGRTQ